MNGVIASQLIEERARLPVSRFPPIHLKRETRRERMASLTASIPCETIEQKTSTYAFDPTPLPFHFPFHNRRSIVETSSFRFISHFTFYSPLESVDSPFHVSFLSFLVSRVWGETVKRQKVKQKVK
jgi:hypothetical protein